MYDKNSERKAKGEKVNLNGVFSILFIVPSRIAILAERRQKSFRAIHKFIYITLLKTNIKITMQIFK